MDKTTFRLLLDKAVAVRLTYTLSTADEGFVEAIAAKQATELTPQEIDRLKRIAEKADRN